MSIATEIATMKVAEGISIDLFRDIVDELERVSTLGNPASLIRNYFITTKAMNG